MHILKKKVERKKKKENASIFFNRKHVLFIIVGKTVVKSFVHWTPDWEVRVRPIARALRFAVGQGISFSRCLSQPKNINRNRRI